jgi:AcrR family transcriptional regulator
VTQGRKDVRGRLQRAAFELFGERGYDRTTAAEIAARVGVTERTFFRHFADKREVAFDGEAEMLAGLTAAVAAAPKDLEPMGVLLWTFQAFEKTFEENRPFNRPRQAIIASTPALRERQVAKAAAMTAALAEALAKRGVDEKTAGLTALTGMAVFDHATRSWFENPTTTLGVYLERALKILHRLSAVNVPPPSLTAELSVTNFWRSVVPLKGACLYLADYLTKH